MKRRLPERSIDTASPRRRVLRAATVFAAGVLGPGGIRAAHAHAGVPAARLALYNTHTGEQLDVVYRENGEYHPDALASIDRVLRDHRTNDVAPIDPQLLDLLHRLGGLVDARQPFHVISGYRSPLTNARLAAASSGVARTSLHVEGRAIDIRLPGRELAQLRNAALSMQAGGVGFYPRTGFVHVDTGRVRSW